jgi:hypothetical protein
MRNAVSVSDNTLARVVGQGTKVGREELQAGNSASHEPRSDFAYLSVVYNELYETLVPCILVPFMRSTFLCFFSSHYFLNYFIQFSSRESLV